MLQHVWTLACSNATNRRYKHPGICSLRSQSLVWEPSGCQRADSRVRRSVSAPIKRCRPAFPMTGDSPSLWAASPAPPWLPSVSSRSPPDPAASGCKMIVQCTNQLIRQHKQSWYAHRGALQSSKGNISNSNSFAYAHKWSLLWVNTAAVTVNREWWWSCYRRATRCTIYQNKRKGWECITLHVFC